jgi:N-carbamoylputrescine amidase
MCQNLKKTHCLPSTLIKFPILQSKILVMPNKKYKIAVIQLNLNDIAENNLKMHQLGSCQNWNRSDFVTRIYTVSFCQSEDVDNFALAEPYIVLHLLLLALCKRIRRMIIFFEKNGGNLPQ